MPKRKLWIFLPLIALLLLAAFPTQTYAQNNGNGNAYGKTDCYINGVHIKSCTAGQLKQAAREQARLNAAPQAKGVAKKFAGVSGDTAGSSPLTTGASAFATMATGTTPDYFGVPNYANSPLPVIDATGAIVAGTGIRKFQDLLPGFCPTLNNLGQCLPIATADTTTFPGSDFYRLGVIEDAHKMHTDLPIATPMHGYVSLDATNTPVANSQQYLGPLIVATRNRPVRVLFRNLTTTAPNIPIDTTYMGAGAISDGLNSTLQASEKRAVIHLHGGNTPWISDGTPHQWVTPAGDTTGNANANLPGFSKGFSFYNVPDMVAPLGLTGSLTDGYATYYWTNEQSGRLLFYHDHAYGITRINVYHGEASGYLIVDPVQEAALLAATVPGTISATVAGSNPPAVDLSPTATANDLAHVLPLVIQDRTWVPDNGVAGGQLAAEDPTWDVLAAPAGSLWWPHVYTPNQNPADLTGANGFGRWDWGPWFFPPQSQAGLVLPSYACSSIAVPTGGTWAHPPLLCPGVPDPTRPTPSNSPSGTPESFMDTPIVNGTAYPKLTVDPTAYRFHILSVGNDRTFNFGLYVADPLTVSVTAGGTGYVQASTTATVSGCGTSATLTPTVSGTGAVTSITVTPTVAGTPIVCTAPAVTIAGVGTGAAAVASVNTDVHMLPAVSAAARPATMPNCPTTLEPVMGGGGLVTALLDATGNPLNGTGLPTGGTSLTSCWPLYNSAYGFTAGPLGENGALSWGNSDGRFGGVPDPTTAGPPIIQIGTEGGLLPAPVVIPSTPISYDYNKRSITVLNVLNHGLLLGPAERADVIIDFSAFAGKTLILYNDAPAPVPGADPRLDYFTNDPDFSATGGAPTTMAGYGPNIRTIMQITVNLTPATPPAVTFSLPTLAAALPNLFSTTQDKIIVPEPFYPAANGLGLAEYAAIQDTSLTLNTVSPLCAAPPCAFPMLPKAIQELFTLDYGRMNATLGVELPLTNFTIQTTIPYGYVDPPTEIFKDGETQIWKITHNGVDTHFIHFHLFTLQVINRVGWDGAMKPPDPNELAFKDTVRMNPLEDIIVALKPMKQSPCLTCGTQPFPFPVPNSWRPLNVTAPLGTTSAIDYTNVDPTNAPAAVVNDLVNFGWEYVWHCHILGHEENDMMRGMIMAVAPDVPVLSVSLNAALPKKTATATLTWTETSSNFTGFTIQKSTDPTFLTGVTSAIVGPTPLSWVDPNAVSTSVSTFYRILASNLVGYTRAYAAPAAGYPNVSADSAWSAVVNTLSGGLLTPTVTFTGNPASAAFNSTFTVTATTNASTLPAITTSTPLVCSVGAVTGSALSASAVVTMLAGSGTCTLSASWAADATYTSATAGPLSTTAILAAPTVTFTGAPATAPVLSTFIVTATTNAGVMPTIVGAGSCSAGAVSGAPSGATATITMNSGSGACALTASWLATANYAAVTLTQSTTAALAAPTVTFTGAPATATFPSSFVVTAATNAGVMPIISVQPLSFCGVGGVTGTSTSATATVTILSGSGTCTISASWPATTTYAAAALTQSTTAGLGTPTASLSALPASMAYLSTFPVTASTNASDLTTFPTITAAGVCSVGPVSGTSPLTATATVTMNAGTGTCTVTASWPATQLYLAATATQSTAAAKIGSATTITGFTPNPSVAGQPVVVSFTVTGAGVIPTGGATVTTTGASCSGALTNGAGSCSLAIPAAGTYTISAAYGGDANYLTSAFTSTTVQQVRDFSISVTPTAATISGGQNQRFTVTVRSLNNFAGTVTISGSIAGLPAGWTISGPVNVTVSAGGSVSARITVSTVKGFPGTRTVTFTGKFGTGVPATGGLSRAVTATLITTS